MKTIVIHHSADFDGLFCREIARKFRPEAELIGWDYGQPKIPFDPEATTYVLDLSPECLGGDTYDSSKLVWIDHHKSAIEKFPTTIPGYRIDGVAACRLTWQWFAYTEAYHQQNFALPGKGLFTDRVVIEPPAVRLAGEYDVWDKRNPDVDAFQLGLRSRKLTEHDWTLLLDSHGSRSATVLLDTLLDNGRLLQEYVNERDKATVENLGFIVEFAGLKFLALNSAGKG